MHHDNVFPVPLEVQSAVLTVEQLARTFQVSPATVRRLHMSGGLPVQSLRVGRRLLFPLSAVQSFLSSSQSPKN
jgi:excisionase family DNA binding protein